MSFDFQQIKVIQSLKIQKITPSDFKGVPDSSGKMWPFGSDQANLILAGRERKRKRTALLRSIRVRGKSVNH
jgi:hypothetical protein